MMIEPFTVREVFLLVVLGVVLVLLVVATLRLQKVSQQLCQARDKQHKSTIPQSKARKFVKP